MPIHPENRHRYPADWPMISYRIRFERAGGRCECRGDCGRPAKHLAVDGRCRNRHGTPAAGTGSEVVLTTAHRDHIPEHCAEDNLVAFCQGCHLHHDRDHHRQSRARRLREAAEAEMVPLFDLAPHATQHQQA
ncbi:hypothetical protein [Amycolatopsis sp. TNS106]|uniref:hypothetical protein n=1 Tax=Amycolatopsis sp. TNS106 TaxID=2861750 RepID=UPI001C577149|nr:hypothetical protein [Amycolatopsis sp. TNS106]QXV63526.1 hypothetical protein CVV72_40920 [Amycolatopsis sp. TNS106]